MSKNKNLVTQDSKVLTEDKVSKKSEVVKVKPQDSELLTDNEFNKKNSKVCEREVDGINIGALQNFRKAFEEARKLRCRAELKDPYLLKGNFL